MELGSIAFTILCDDADLDRALPKVVNAGYRKAGQVCTSVQILLVQEKVMPAVEAQLTGQVKALKFGDPYDPATVAGPVISGRAAIRIEFWIAEAMAKGAQWTGGGAQHRRVVPPN